VGIRRRGEGEVSTVDGFSGRLESGGWACALTGWKGLATPRVM
jgi:hypothetical protein